jgi:GTP:adenosylcobinamide-phosphate guanylyltransferase
LHRFDLETNNKHLIVSFTPSTKQQTILLETDKNIVKIFKKDGKIYLEDDNKNIFSISHLAE